MQAPHLSVDRLPRLDPIGWWRRASLPQRLFVALVVFAALLRIAACLAWWPTIPTFADAWPYAAYAAHRPFSDPQHPAGYSLFLAFVGLFSRQVGVVTVLTHLIGLVTGCLLYGAVKRLTGSAWPALLAAAFVLLNGDQIYMEQLVASEPLSAFLLVLTLYAGVRLFDSRAHRLHWSVAIGVLAAATTIVRTESIFLAPVVAVAIIVALWPSVRGNWRNLQFPIVMLLVWGVMLFGYGLAKQAATGSFVIGPAPGWQEYGRAATFANCKLFTPPAGTRGLCETTPPANRLGHDHYLYDPTSPAVRLFGVIDNKMARWGRGRAPLSRASRASSCGTSTRSCVTTSSRATSITCREPEAVSTVSSTGRRLRSGAPAQRHQGDGGVLRPLHAAPPSPARRVAASLPADLPVRRDLAVAVHAAVVAGPVHRVAPVPRRRHPVRRFRVRAVAARSAARGISRSLHGAHCRPDGSGRKRCPVEPGRNGAGAPFSGSRGFRIRRLGRGFEEITDG